MPRKIIDGLTFDVSDGMVIIDADGPVRATPDDARMAARWLRSAADAAENPVDADALGDVLRGLSE